jgi:hypothetical protein
MPCLTCTCVLQAAQVYAPGYSSIGARSLTKEEVEALRAQGRLPEIYMKMPPSSSKASPKFKADGGKARAKQKAKQRWKEKEIKSAKRSKKKSKEIKSARKSKKKSKEIKSARKSKKKSKEIKSARKSKKKSVSISTEEIDTEGMDGLPSGKRKRTKPNGLQGLEIGAVKKKVKRNGDEDLSIGLMKKVKRNGDRLSMQTKADMQPNKRAENRIDMRENGLIRKNDLDAGKSIKRNGVHSKIQEMKLKARSDGQKGGSSGVGNVDASVALLSDVIAPARRNGKKELGKKQGKLNTNEESPSALHTGGPVSPKRLKMAQPRVSATA